jgi:hypothetical protein
LSVRKLILLSVALGNVPEGPIKEIRSEESWTSMTIEEEIRGIDKAIERCKAEI